MAESDNLGRQFTAFMALVVVCFAIVIALQSATLHEQRSRIDVEPREEASLANLLLHQFPGRFQTEAEIAEQVWLLRQKYDNVTGDPASQGIEGHSVPWIDLQTIHTCCCKITITFIKPKDYTNPKTGRVTPLAKVDGYDQYFYSETCTHVPGVPGCYCAPDNILTRAIFNTGTVKSPTYDMQWAYIGQVCRSLSI